MFSGLAMSTRGRASTQYSNTIGRFHWHRLSQNSATRGVPGPPYLTRGISLRGSSEEPRPSPTPFLRPGFLSSQDSAQVLFKRREKRLLTQWSAGPFVGTWEFRALLGNRRGEEAAFVGGRAEEGTDHDHTLLGIRQYAQISTWWVPHHCAMSSM